jgi:hypothetical protein
MKTSTASSDRATKRFSTFISKASVFSKESRRAAPGVFFSVVALAIMSCLALVTSAFAEVLTEEPPAASSLYIHYAHIAVTALAVIFAMRLAAVAFARPPCSIADIPTDPRYLTSPGYYWFGLAAFTVLTALIFLVSVVLYKEVIPLIELFKIPFLPEWLSRQLIDAANEDTAPYLLIVCLMAALYLYLLHKEAEWNILLMLRDLIHIWIAIPTRIRSIVAQMMVSFSVPEPFAGAITSGQVGVRTEDFEKDPSTFERQWAELSYIQLWLTRQLGSGEAGFFDDGEFKLDALLAEYAVLSADVVGFREDPSSHAADVRALLPRAKALRGKLARVVGCYLVHQYGVNERLVGAANEFGVPVKRGANENPLKYIFIYLIALALSVYIGVYVSAIAFDLLTGVSLEKTLSTQDDELVWRWISYSAANYGLAISVILLIRYIAWTSSATTNVAYLWTYCWTGLVAGLVGPLGLAIMVKLYNVPRFEGMPFISIFGAELKWGVGPAIIAVFISYYMDRQTSSALPDINQSRGTIAWRFAVSLALALATLVLLLPPLLSLPAPVVGDWSREKLHAVAIGTTFMITFGLAFAAQFALRKPQRSTAGVPAVA